MTFLNVEDNPFRGRILNERVISGNESFRIVEDRDPVVPGHLLLFTFSEAPSFADSDSEALCDFLEGQFSNLYAGRRYLLVERGRARFCSSFGNIIHAHGHLAPEDTCGRIHLETEKAWKFQCLRDAFRVLKGENEYLLLGQIGGNFQVVSPLHNKPKRLARMILCG